MNLRHCFAFVALFVVSEMSPTRDCKKPSILGGRVNIRNRGQTARYSCRKPYRLFGSPVSSCIRGVWRPSVPKCGIDCPVTHVRLGNEYEHRTTLNISDENGSLCPVGFEALPFLTAHCDGFISDFPYPICLAAPCASTYKTCHNKNCLVIPGKALKELYVSCEPGFVSSIGKIVCDTTASAFIGCYADRVDKFSINFDLVSPNWGVPKSEFNDDGIFMWFNRKWMDDDLKAYLPDNDHTYDSDLGGFLFSPSHLMNMGDRARLHSPRYSLEDNITHCFTFWYYMENRGVGELNVFVNNVLKWTMAGPQGNYWTEGFVSLPSGAVTVVLEAMRGFSSHAFISVDDFSIIIEGDHAHPCFGEEEELTTTSAPEDTLPSINNSDIVNSRDISDSTVNPHAVDLSTQDAEGDIHASSSATSSVSTSLKTFRPTYATILSSIDSNQQGSMILSETTEHISQSTLSSSVPPEVFNQTSASTSLEFHQSTSGIETVHAIDSFSVSTPSLLKTSQVLNFHSDAKDTVGVDVNTNPLPDTVEGIQLNAHKTENLAPTPLPVETFEGSQLIPNETATVAKKFSSTVLSTKAPPTLRPIPDDILENNHSDSENDINENNSIIQKTDNEIENSEHDFVGAEIATQTSLPVESAKTSGAATEEPSILRVHIDHHSTIHLGRTGSSHAEDVGFNRGSKFFVNSFASETGVDSHSTKFSNENLDNGIDPVDKSVPQKAAISPSGLDELDCGPFDQDCAEEQNPDNSIEKIGVPVKDESTFDNLDFGVVINQTTVNSGQNQLNDPPLNGKLADQSDSYQDSGLKTSKIDAKLHFTVVSLSAVALLLMIVAVITVFKVARKRMKKQQRRVRMSEDDLSLNLHLSNSKEVLNFSLLRPDRI